MNSGNNYVNDDKNSLNSYNNSLNPHNTALNTCKTPRNPLNPPKKEENDFPEEWSLSTPTPFQNMEDHVVNLFDFWSTFVSREILRRKAESFKAKTTFFWLKLTRNQVWTLRTSGTVIMLITVRSVITLRTLRTVITVVTLIPLRTWTKMHKIRFWGRFYGVWLLLKQRTAVKSWYRLSWIGFDTSDGGTDASSFP